MEGICSVTRGRFPCPETPTVGTALRLDSHGDAGKGKESPGPSFEDESLSYSLCCLLAGFCGQPDGNAAEVSVPAARQETDLWNWAEDEEEHQQTLSCSLL